MVIKQLYDIEIYTKSLELARKCFHLCKINELNKEYSLQDQLKRSSLSVAANIAEGYGRRTKKDFANFLTIALGSTNETLTYLDFIELEFNISTKLIKDEYLIIAKRLYSFRKYLLSFDLKNK